jgi:hypothetical protein
MLVFFVAAICGMALAKDCSQTSYGQLSLKDLGSGSYNGETGGLYPSGSNTNPAAHESDGVFIANNQIYPRDTSGNQDDSNGKIVFLSIGMSNTNQEWAQFIADAANINNINSKLVLFNGAKGGTGLEKASDHTDSYGYWSGIKTNLISNGYDAKQVQVIWLKTAYGNPPSGQSFPLKAQTMKADLIKVARLIKTHFPNSQIVYATSRIYGDYSDNSNRQEPTAFEGAFGFKWMIEDQINEANAFLNFNPNKGTVHSPYIKWGPYIWADGLTATNDGLIWECSDFKDDGHHPADPQGIEKVSDLLTAFFINEATATPWFFN